MASVVNCGIDYRPGGNLQRQDCSLTLSIYLKLRQITADCFASSLYRHFLIIITIVGSDSFVLRKDFDWRLRRQILIFAVIQLEISDCRRHSSFLKLSYLI